MCSAGVERTGAALRSEDMVNLFFLGQLFLPLRSLLEEDEMDKPMKFGGAKNNK